MNPVSQQQFLEQKLALRPAGWLSAVIVTPGKGVSLQNILIPAYKVISRVVENKDKNIKGSAQEHKQQ